MNNIRNLILDMDGVLWHGETPLPDLPGFFARLDALGIDYALATNNATRTASLYTEKLARFGVSMPADRIVTSAEATAAFLRSVAGQAAGGTGHRPSLDLCRHYVEAR